MRFLVFMIPAGYQPSSFAKASADSSQRGALGEKDGKQQVVDWWKRCPAEDGDVIEIRQIAETADFPPELLKALQEPGPGSKEPGAAAKPHRTVTRAPHTATGAPGPWKKSKTSRTKEQD